nr:FRG domain-containing protein [uncultured Hyphomonas sp.]
MEEFYIDSIENLFTYVDRVKGRFYFRGFSKYDCHMKPSLGRYGDNLINDEIKIIREYVNLPILDEIPFKVRNLHELLDLGQHYGLPTRFLDWTENPLIALFFAIGKPPFNNSRSYIAMINRDRPEIGDSWDDIDDVAPYYFSLQDWNKTKLWEIDPLELTDLEKFNIFKTKVNHPLFEEKFNNLIQTISDYILIRYQINDFNLRIKKQWGLFSVHKNVKAAVPIDFLDGLVTIKLNMANKKELLNILSNQHQINEDEVLPKPIKGSPLEYVMNWCIEKKNQYSIGRKGRTS